VANEPTDAHDVLKEVDYGKANGVSGGLRLIQSAADW
jgi:hypothetical protein